MTRRRWALLCAAPPTLYLLASLVVFIALVAWGSPNLTKQQRIASVIQGFPADAVGLRENDVVLSVDGESVDASHPPRDVFARSQGRSVEMAISRDGVERKVSITPKLDRDQWFIGVGLAPLETCERWPVGVAAREGLANPMRRLVELSGIWRGAIGQRVDASGPVRLAYPRQPTPCGKKLLGVRLIETPLALCSVLSLFVLLGFAINSVRTSRASSRPPQ